MAKKKASQKTVVYFPTSHHGGILTIELDQTVPFAELPDVVSKTTLNDPEGWKHTQTWPKHWLYPTFEAARDIYVHRLLREIEDATAALRRIGY